MSSPSHLHLEAKFKLLDILNLAVSNKASDIHLGDFVCPCIRWNGNLVFVSEHPFEKGQTLEMLKDYVSAEEIEKFKRELELDCSFGVKGVGRFRVNVFQQRGAVGCAIRALPFEPLTFDQIGFPKPIADYLISKPTGLILVTGATGSGKTTTLATIIDYINESENCYIVTIEDPIEFIFKNKKSMINQREVGSDTHSFNESLKHVLRQDPDVILVGEMRDLETIQIALNVAETGHLVFATLHTPDAIQSINRIIDVFPPDQQQQVRIQFSFVLQAVISQQLLPKTGGGLALATEILLANPSVRAMIRESKSHQIYSILQTSTRDGMRTMNMSLADLVKSGTIGKDVALTRCMDIAEFERLFQDKTK